MMSSVLQARVAQLQQLAGLAHIPASTTRRMWDGQRRVRAQGVAEEAVELARGGDVQTMVE